MAIRILSVTPGSPAFQAGIQPDGFLCQVNGEPVVDEIDYQALTTATRLSLDIISPSGQASHLILHKRLWEPLGLCLDETTAMKPRQCRNHCVFCFIDQMPPGMRKTLYVKDDDWRLSLMMGNYVTLTNLDDTEFERILRRKASPLYISVHATDPEVRIRMLRNPKAGMLMNRLRQLYDHGLKFHAQIVLCPGLNDGVVLDQTLHDLASLLPSAQSVAVVPVGTTRFRNRLAQLQTFTPESAAKLLDQLAPYQAFFLRTAGTRFVFPSDEFYCLCGRSIPPDDAYEDYVQIENGVGMLRKLEQECEEAAADLEPVCSVPRHILIPTGVSAAPFIKMLADRYAPSGTEVEVIPVQNRFFGETITVTGLLVGQDLAFALREKQGDEILICETMLRDRSDTFLDDFTVDDLEKKIQKPVHVVENSGESFIRALRCPPWHSPLIQDDSD